MSSMRVDVTVPARSRWRSYDDLLRRRAGRRRHAVALCGAPGGGRLHREWTSRMARAARHPRVAAEQRKRCQLVLRDAERRRREPLDAMARCAVHGLSSEGRLTVVRILVARRTGGECRSHRFVRPADVTRRAGHADVLSAQRVTRAVMVEPRAVYRAEARRDVAAAARPCQAPAVRIRVTARAVLERHRAQHGYRLPRRIDRRAEAWGQVTFRARDVAMLARERVRASRVVEPGCVLPGPGVMTPRARALEPAAVRVGVTARAVCFEAHPSGRRPAR